MEGTKRNVEEIRTDIINAFRKSGDLYAHLRDEDDENDCPEMHGVPTYFVLKKTDKQRSILNICDNYYKYAIDLLTNNEWTINGDTITHDGEKPIRWRITGQSYTKKPGAGSRGTTKNNKGTSFELYMVNSDILSNLVAKIAYSANRIKDAQSSLHYEDISHIGGSNTRTNQSLDSITSANPLKHGGKNIADVIIKGENDLPISLKYTEKSNDVITLWNMGLYGGKCTYENMMAFISKFFNKEDLGDNKSIIENALIVFMPDKGRLSRSEWESIKNQNGKSSSYIDIPNSNIINEKYIKSILRFAWGIDYYLVAGEGRNNQVCGFWVDKNAVENIISGTLTDIKIIIPLSSKMLGISFELNGIHYRIDMRDRRGANRFTAGEVVFDKGLNMKDIMSINIPSLQTYPPELTPEIRKQIG